MQVHHKNLNRLLLRSIGEFSDIALQLVRFKKRGQQIVVVSEGAVARTLFLEILGPGLFFALGRRTAYLLRQRPKRLHLVPLDLAKKVLFSTNVETRPMCTRKLLKHFQHLLALEDMRFCELLKNLMEIPMSASGYSVSYLKGTLGQAKAYIRPMQKDLSLEVTDPIKVRTLNVRSFQSRVALLFQMQFKRC